MLMWQSLTFWVDVNEAIGNMQGSLQSMLHKGWGCRREEGFWRLCVFTEAVFKCLQSNSRIKCTTTELGTVVMKILCGIVM